MALPKMSLRDALCNICFPAGSIPSISEDSARGAFILYASSKCCYSSAPAKDGVIMSMEPFNTYRVMRYSTVRVKL